MNLSYVPVYLPGAPMLKLNYTYNKKPLNTVQSNSIFKYNYMLVSTYHCIKNIKNIREEYNLHDELFIFGDSGGFQHLTLGAKLNPLEVLRWQEINCDAGFIFDNPILKNDDHKTILNKQLITTENAFVALNHRKNKNLELIAIIQGHTPYYIDSHIQLYEEKGGLNGFERISIGGLVPISNNINKLVKILTYFCYKIQKYKKPLHFLGISNIKIFYVIVYLAKKLDLDITFDSSSPFNGARFGSYYLNATQKIHYMDANLEKCKCYACVDLKSAIQEKQPPWCLGSLTTLHNLNLFISKYNQIKGYNLKMIESNISKHSLKIINNILNKGEKYAYWLTPTNIDKTKQNSLYSF